MDVQTLNINEVKTQLSHLLNEVAAGSEVIITKRGKPLAKIIKIDAGKSGIRFGILKGKVKISEDFDALLPEEILSEFEGPKCVS